MIKAVIFDMDGLLIDSEPLWERAEQEVFNVIGVPLKPDMCKQTTGLRVDEVVQHWFEQFPWQEPSKDEVATRIVKRLIELINDEGEPMSGVDHVLKLFIEAGLPLAIASSSYTEIIDAVLTKLDITQHMKVIHSAEFETHGKPHPAVYLTAAQKLGVAPTECLAFEDSPNGVLSAKAAKMKCVAIPEPALRHDKRFGIADYVLDSLQDFKPDMLAA